MLEKKSKSLGPDEEGFFFAIIQGGVIGMPILKAAAPERAARRTLLEAPSP